MYKDFKNRKMQTKIIKEIIFATLFVLILSGLLFYFNSVFFENLDIMPIFLSFLGILITSITVIIALGDRFIIKEMMKIGDTWVHFVYVLFVPTIICFLGIVFEIVAIILKSSPVGNYFSYIGFSILIILMTSVIRLLLILYLAVLKSNVDENGTIDSEVGELRKSKSDLEGK